jgi:hypothetical protein
MTLMTWRVIQTRSTLENMRQMQETLEGNADHIYVRSGTMVTHD